MTGELLWQDKARSGVQVVTALSGDRVAVGYARGPVRVLDAATGAELSSLRGVVEVVPLTPSSSLLVGSSHVRLAGADLEPVSGRVQLPPAVPWVTGAAGGRGGVSLAVDKAVWFMEPDGTHRATMDVLGGFPQSVAHDAASGCWWVTTRSETGDDIRFELLAVTSTGDVLDRRPLPWGDRLAWLRDGRALVIGTEEGLLSVDPVTGDVRRIDVPAAPSR